MAGLAKGGFLERKCFLGTVFQEAGKLPLCAGITTALRPEQRVGAENSSRTGHYTVMWSARHGTAMQGKLTPRPKQVVGQSEAHKELPDQRKKRDY